MEYILDTSAPPQHTILRNVRVTRVKDLIRIVTLPKLMHLAL